MEKLELLKKLNELKQIDKETIKLIQNSISPAYKEGIARDYLSAKIITWGANDSITVKIYDTKTRKSESFNLDASIPNAAEGTMVFNKLYLTGGHGPVKCSYEIDSIRKQMIRKQNMINARYVHSLCSLLNQIFSIGGYNGS